MTSATGAIPPTGRRRATGWSGSSSSAGQRRDRLPVRPVAGRGCPARDPGREHLSRARSRTTCGVGGVNYFYPIEGFTNEDLRLPRELGEVGQAGEYQPALQPSADGGQSPLAARLCALGPTGGRAALLDPRPGAATRCRRASKPRSCRRDCRRRGNERSAGRRGAEHDGRIDAKAGPAAKVAADAGGGCMPLATEFAGSLDERAAGWSNIRT